MTDSTAPKPRCPEIAITPGGAPGDVRPAYAPPRVTRKKAVTRATLFSGGNQAGPAAAPPLVADG